MLGRHGDGSWSGGLAADGLVDQEAGHAGGPADVAVPVDDERLGTGAVDEVELVGRTAAAAPPWRAPRRATPRRRRPWRARGRWPTARRCRGRSGGGARRRRPSGAAASSTWRPRPRSATRGPGAPRARVLDVDGPGAAVGALAADAEVAAEVDAHTRRAGARSSSTTRSAARPLPMPPGSKPVPAGSRTAVPSSSMSVHPTRASEGAQGDRGARSLVDRRTSGRSRRPRGSPARWGRRHRR